MALLDGSDTICNDLEKIASYICSIISHFGVIAQMWIALFTGSLQGRSERRLKIQSTGEPACYCNGNKATWKPQQDSQLCKNQILIC